MLRPNEHLTEGGELAADEKAKSNLPDDLGADELLGSDEEIPDWGRPKSLETALREDWVTAGGMPQAHEGFRKSAQAQGLTPGLFGEQSWDDVRMLTLSAAIRSPADAKRYYYSRKYSGYLTPRMFGLAAEAIQKLGPNHSMKSFAGAERPRLVFSQHHAAGHVSAGRPELGLDAGGQRLDGPGRIGVGQPPGGGLFGGDVQCRRGATGRSPSRFP